MITRAMGGIDGGGVGVQFLLNGKDGMVGWASGSVSDDA